MQCLIFLLISCFSSLFVNAADDTFSLDRLTAFYDEFLCEEKNDLAADGLTSPCTITPNPNPFVPPPDPPPPPFVTNMLPIIFVNNSGFSDSEVYIVLTGVDVTGTFQQWGVIDTISGTPGFGQVTFENVVVGQDSTVFSYLLSALPEASGGRVIYVPEVISALVWFSIETKLNMPVVSTMGGPAIVQPNFTDPGDPNYLTNFDIFEYAFLLTPSPNVAADATAVSFFSIPLYGYLAGATSVGSNTGLFQPRSYIMEQASAAFNAAPAASQWRNLILTNGGQILRLVSPGKGMAASTPLFDPNYLDDSAAYGYSYIEDIWTGASSFYRTHGLDMTVTITNPSTNTYNYTGNVQVDNTFLFTPTDGGPAVDPFDAPATGPSATDTTTFKIFSALNLITPTPAAGTAGDAISKLFEESVIAGLVPTTDTLSLDYLAANQANFYKVNSNLTGSGPTTGPWFDLYSKVLHSLGLIYTYGFDEPLWPQVLLAAAPYQNGVTYLGITIGNVE